MPPPFLLLAKTSSGINVSSDSNHSLAISPSLSRFLSRSLRTAKPLKAGRQQAAASRLATAAASRPVAARALRPAVEGRRERRREEAAFQ